MQVVIMAGGQGERLRPLTLDRPMPLAPILNRPLLEHLTHLIRRHGFTAATVTAHYQADRIKEYLADHVQMPVAIDLVHETAPLGTAGGVRAAWRGSEAVLVLSGDSLTDVDLQQVLAYHRRRRAVATMVLQSVEDSSRFGTVDIGRNGRVQRFAETPPTAGLSSWVNAGIYVLEPEAMALIPEKTPYDFGRDLFSQLMAEGLPVFGFPNPGYWCDAGTLNSYFEANLAALRREVFLEISESEREPGIWIGQGAEIDPTAQLKAPVLIGAGARIGARAHVRHSVIGPAAQVGEGASLTDCIVLPEQRVSASTRLSQAIITGHGVLQPAPGWTQPAVTVPQTAAQTMPAT